MNIDREGVLKEDKEREGQTDRESESDVEGE